LAREKIACLSLQTLKNVQFNSIYPKEMTVSFFFSHTLLAHIWIIRFTCPVLPIHSRAKRGKMYRKVGTEEEAEDGNPLDNGEVLSTLGRGRFLVTKYSLVATMTLGRALLCLLVVSNPFVSSTSSLSSGCTMPNISLASRYYSTFVR
jgi:hypothetical protein